VVPTIFAPRAEQIRQSEYGSRFCVQGGFAAAEADLDRGNSVRMRARCPRHRSGLRGCSVEFDLDFAVDDADRVGFQIFDCRRVEHFSGADIKARGVEWALDRVAVEPSV
jgi:hypothetical protein